MENTEKAFEEQGLISAMWDMWYGWTYHYKEEAFLEKFQDYKVISAEERDPDAGYDELRHRDEDGLHVCLTESDH